MPVLLGYRPRTTDPGTPVLCVHVCCSVLNMVCHWQFVAESFHARSREEHKGYVELLDGPAPEYMATTYGVVFDSVLNRFVVLSLA